MNDAERIALLQDRLDRVNASAWIEVVFADNFELMVGKSAEHPDKVAVGMTNMPAFTANRWACDDFADLEAVIRRTIIEYLEGKIKEIKKRR